MYCPECGEGLTLESPNGSASGSTGTKIYGTATHIAETSGDVIGSTVSGTGNIIGKEVEYIVSGSVINLQVNSISAETLQELNDIISRPMQLETRDFQLGQIHNINTEFTEAKANEVRVAKEETNQILKDIDQISREDGIRIEQIRVGEMQVSRTELTYQDVMLEGNEYFYKGAYSNAINSYDKAIEIDSNYANAWFNKGKALGNLGVVLANIGDNLAYRHGLHFCCQEVYPYRNRKKV